jgi:putative flippase GtrA
VSFFIDLGITAVFVTWKGAYFAELFGFNKINYNKGIFGINFVHNYVENGEDLNVILFLVIGQVVILVANYIFSKFVIFKKSKNAKK